MQFQIKIVKDNTRDVIEQVHKNVELALDLMGETVEKHAIADSPVDTGRLKNSITHEVESDACYVGTNVEYAPYVEFIDRYHHEVGKAHFLRDAAQDNIKELQEIAEAVLGRT